MKLKQYNLGMKFGALRFHASRAMIYMSMYSMFALSAASIRTIQEWFPWFTFPMLLGCIALWFILAMLIEHIFVYKAEIDYTTKQAYIDENPAAKALKRVEKDVAKNKKMLEEILKRINNAHTSRNR